MKILLVILNQGQVFSALSSKILEHYINTLKNGKHSISINYSTLIMVDNNRNTIVDNFLKSDFDYLLMIDEDTVPFLNPIDLVDMDKDVIILPALTFQKNQENPVIFNIYEKDGRYYKTLVCGKEKFVEIDAGGTGCILIKRKVLEKIKRPFESVWNDKTGIREKGSDIYFCEKVKSKGFKIWTHWDYICDHYKTLSLFDVADIIVKIRKEKIPSIPKKVLEENA